MKSKQQKQKELKRLKEKLPASKITVFTAFSKAGDKGLAVGQMAELRRLLRSVGGDYIVTKKTLMDIALRGLGLEADVFGMAGSIGLAVGDGDPYAISKKLYEFSKKNPALHFFGALFEGGFMGEDKFLEIAKIPSREMLIARLLGMMKYPITGLYVVLNEIAKKK